MTTTSSSSRKVNSAADSSSAFCAPTMLAAGVLGDAARDAQLFLVQPETDDVDRDRRLALLQRRGDGAGIGVAGLETVGDQDDRVGHRVRCRREVGRRTLEREPDRRPPDRRVVGDLLAQRRPCRPLRPAPSGRTTGSSPPCRPRVLSPLCPNTRNPTLISGRSAGIASITWLSTRLAASIRGSPVSVAAAIEPGRVHHQLDVDLRARFRLGEGPVRCLDQDAGSEERAATSPRSSPVVIHVWARVVTRIHLP